MIYKISHLRVHHWSEILIRFSRLKADWLLVSISNLGKDLGEGRNLGGLYGTGSTPIADSQLGEPALQSRDQGRQQYVGGYAELHIKTPSSLPVLHHALAGREGCTRINIRERGRVSTTEHADAAAVLATASDFSCLPVFVPL